MEWIFHSSFLHFWYCGFSGNSVLPSNISPSIIEAFSPFLIHLLFFFFLVIRLLSYSVRLVDMEVIKSCTFKPVIKFSFYVGSVSLSWLAVSSEVKIPFLPLVSYALSFIWALFYGPPPPGYILAIILVGIHLWFFVFFFHIYIFKLLRCALRLRFSLVLLATG